MNEVELLRSIRPIWLNRMTQILARDANIREDARAQLSQFFDLLEQAVESGDCSWLDPLLSTWASSLPETDLEASTSNLTLFLKEIVLQTNQISAETLESAQAGQVWSAVLPAFLYCFEKASAFEMQVRIDHVTDQLHQVQQTLERLDQTKSDFIAVAAHELKTPLTLIEGYSAMLRDAAGSSELGSFQKEMLDGISNGTRRLKAIIDDMIDVSLIDNDLLSLNYQPVWINRLLSVLKDELAPSIQERGLKLEIAGFPGSTEMTYGDPERLLQVLRNVLTNAVKYTPDGGRIWVDGRKLPGFLEVVVHDNGIGIDTENQTVIFEKFTRLGDTALHSSGKTKFKGGGPGLGLHIARGILESHGGAIWAESPGYDEVKCPGSVFHILLPQRASPPQDRLTHIVMPVTHSTYAKEATR